MKQLFTCLLVLLLALPAFSNDKFKTEPEDATESNVQSYNKPISSIPETSIYLHPMSLLFSFGLDVLPQIVFVTVETEISPGLNFVTQPVYGFGEFGVGGVKVKNYSDIELPIGLRKYFSQESNGWFIQGMVGYAMTSFKMEYNDERASAEGSTVFLKINFGSSNRDGDGLHTYWDIGYLYGASEVEVTSDNGDFSGEPPAFSGLDINLGLGFGF